MSAPPGNRRLRPRQEAQPADETAIRSDNSTILEGSPLAQMKRRREAALRLPPLASGMRDPHFDLYPRDGVS